MPSRRRPHLVTALGLTALVVSALGFARLTLSFTLPELPLAVPPAYLAGTGGTLGAVCLAMALGLLRGNRWAPAFTRAAALALAAWYWADRLLLARSDYVQRSWPAAAAITAVLIGAALWIPGQPSARAFFGETSA